MAIQQAPKSRWAYLGLGVGAVVVVAVFHHGLPWRVPAPPSRFLAQKAAYPAVLHPGAAETTQIRQIDAVIRLIPGARPAPARLRADHPLPNGPQPVVWREAGRVYRAIHCLAVQDARSRRFVPISPDLTNAYLPGSSGFGVDGITAVARTGDGWVVGTLTGRLAVSRDGHRWLLITGLPQRSITAIAALTGTPGAVVVGYGGYGTATPEVPGHIYATFDAGRHWVDWTGGLPDAPVQAIRASVPRHGTRAYDLRAEVDGRWYEMVTPGHWLFAAVNPGAGRATPPAALPRSVRATVRSRPPSAAIKARPTSRTGRPAAGGRP